MSTKQPRVLLPLMNVKNMSWLVQNQTLSRKNSAFYKDDFLSDNKPHVQNLYKFL